MKRSALFAVMIVVPTLVPAITAAQDSSDQTGSINRTDPARILTEREIRDRLTRAGYSAIGSIERDADGVWRTTAMKGDAMMSIGISSQGNIEDR